MTIGTKSLAALATSLALVLSACGGGGGSADSGTLRLAMTDAPACGYDHVNVTVQKVRVHESSTAADADAGWSEVVLSPARRLDLLTLSNGVLAELGQTALPAGHYTQLRLVLASNDATTPLANSLVLTGTTKETALATPSAQQSGLKMNVDITVAPNQLADFVLDFDACKSVVSNGASGNFILKPVVTVVPRMVSGVAGFADATVAGTTVSLQQAGVVVKATAPDSTGKFLLQPVAAGTYDLVLTAPGRATTVVTGVPVTTEVTSINTVSTPIVMATAATGFMSGTVTTTAPIDATLAATQVLANGDKIEVRSVAADATTGAYSLGVPASAPMVAAYAAAPASLSFAADATAGATYLLSATSGSTPKNGVRVTVTSGAVATTNFTF